MNFEFFPNIHETSCFMFHMATFFGVFHSRLVAFVGNFQVRALEGDLLLYL